MVALRTTFVSLLVVVGACGVGEVPGGPGGTVDASPASAAYETMVKPAVTRCATPVCHAGPQPPNLSSADALQASYKTKPGTGSLVVTHVGDGQPHNGITYLSAAEKQAFVTWVGMYGN